MYNFERQLNFVGEQAEEIVPVTSSDDNQGDNCDNDSDDFDCNFSDDEEGTFTIETKNNASIESSNESLHASSTFIVTSRLWDEETLPPIKNKDEYSTLYGIFIETYFTLLIHIKNGTKQDFILAKKQLVKNTIVIPRTHSSSYSQFAAKIGKQILDQGITLEQLMNAKNKFGKESTIMSLIISECNSIGIAMNEPLRVFLESELKFYSEKYANNLLDTIALNKTNYEKDLFDYILYEYQINEEKRYWMKRDFAKEFESLEPYMNKIKNYVNGLDKSITECYKFQKTFYSTNLEIFGIPDIICKKSIIELKFINEVDINHYIQLILYGLIRYTPVISRDTWQLELLNLQNGTHHKIMISEAIKLFELQQCICSIMSIKLNYTVFIYDLETTGLDTDTCEIVECHIREYFYNEIIVDDLVLPSVEFLPEEIIKLTGITEKELRVKGITIEALRKKIARIFKTCNNPIFIAHNGTQFDHKIMQRLEIFPENYKFLLDSKTIIGQFYTKKNLYKSKETSLIKMHKEIVNKDIKNAHRANADVSMIVDIFKSLNITLQNILVMGS
jgi:DNA polymerase III epsilon subunit-like protein